MVNLIRSSYKSLVKEKPFIIEKNSCFRQNNENGKWYRAGRWTDEEHQIFLKQMLKIGLKNWKEVFMNFNIVFRWKSQSQPDQITK
jgi:hypothetical protein